MMNIISATNPQWANAEQTAINLDVNIEGVGVIPFSASSTDAEAHGRAMFAQAAAGNFGAIAAKPATPLAEVKALKLRQVEQARDAETVKNVSAHGRQWQADERSQKLLSSSITLAGAGLPLPAEWRDALNSNMPITTLADLLAIAGAMAVQTQDAYSKSWALKANVAAAATVDAVNAVAW